MITGIHHIALRCEGRKHFDETVNFYEKLLGLKAVHQWGTEEKPCVMLTTGAGCVEIFADAQEKFPQGAIQHVAFVTDDPDEIIEKVRNAGYQVTIEPKDLVIESQPPFPVRIAFCIGPAGEEVEFFKER